MLEGVKSVCLWCLQRKKSKARTLNPKARGCQELLQQDLPCRDPKPSDPEPCKDQIHHCPHIYTSTSECQCDFLLMMHLAYIYIYTYTEDILDIVMVSGEGVFK